MSSPLPIPPVEPSPRGAPRQAESAIVAPPDTPPPGDPPAPETFLEETRLWERRFYWVLWGALAIRLVLALTLDLTPDEAYYWELSRRLDLSYFDHPPMVAYWIALGRSLFGETPLAVRFPTLLGFLALSRILYELGRRLTGHPRTGTLACLLLNATPAGMALGFITTPDAPLALFWGLGALGFVRVLEDDRWPWWLLVGCCLGAGALSKYNMIFFVPAVAIVILGFAPLRPLVFTFRYWLMVGLAFLGTVPILLWNHGHEWASFRFQFQHGFRESQRTVLGSTGEFLGGQLGTIGPALFPLLWVVVLHALGAGWQKDDRKRFFLGALAFPMMAFFAANGVRSKVEANWPQVAYLSAMPLAVEWLDRENRSRPWAWIAGPSALLTLLVVVQALTLVLPLPSRTDVSTRLHGWTGMGEKIRELDRRTGGQAVFVAQGAPLTALVGFYGRLSSDRVAEVHGTGNWRFWWQGRSVATGATVVYVDDGRSSEAMAVAREFSGPFASETLPLSSRGRVVRTMTFTTLENCRGGTVFR